MVRAAMRVVVLGLCLGILMMWIVMPTSTYKQKWVLSIRAKANTRYLGTEAVAKSSKIRSQKWWKRPVLVKGPLGIVTSTELGFLIMFIALLLWSFSTYLTNFFSNLDPDSGERIWQVKLDDTALAFGLVGNVCLAFLFFPVSRGSSVLPLIGLTSEASIKYHIWLGHIVMTLFTAHGLCYIIFWASTHQIKEMIKWEKTGISNLAGEISLLAGLAMWATTFPRIRRKMFELFFYTHYLYIFFIVFFIFHVGMNYAAIMIPGVYLFVVDRFLRFLQSRPSVRLLSSRVLPCEAVELNFSKSPELTYTSTSTIFVNVPSISKLQWHPFTMTSNSNLEPDKLSVVIKSEGSWSKKLYQMLSSPSTADRLDVAVEGPYGPASTHYLRHDKLVMVCGGSGITPFISIIRELIFRSATLNAETPQVLLICAFKNSCDLTLLDLILPLSGTPSEISHLRLQIEAYVTREKQPADAGNDKNLLRTVWFKPNAADMPIHAVLGPNSWLWLGLIISSSFAIFLILLGILTYYHIYPIDKNTNKIYPAAAKSALNMLFICVCIAMTSTAAFLINKKGSSAKAKQVQITNAPTPLTSPGSWFYNADRELESLPTQSLVQATNLHYGSRPDLKKILFDCEESSVGVLVCGPRKMRHEVATICSSGLAENLHFESISFSW
ncbi:hypothetical protein Syun_013222 [Stephania yunnanensis]|uniref:ferric-chelate reductase (NADH) n=1 Tax=Stephania yunnanensis TaxID=152371 RepID=A0AAP0K367_9MAGN